MNRSAAVCAGALVLAACGSILGVRKPATPNASDPTSKTPNVTPIPDRELQTSTPFDENALAKIFRHSPLLDPPLDPTNRHAGDPRAAQLGQWFFFDKRVSKNGELGCVSCHEPERAFSDGRALAQGLGTTDRNTPALWNAAWQRWFFWDGRADSLWAQALQPIESQIELGGNRMAIAHLIQRDAGLCAAYEAIFGALPDLTDARRFPADARPLPGRDDDALARAWSSMQEADRDAVNRVFANTGKALEAYVRRIQSRHSAFDHFVTALRQNDALAASLYPEAARRGLALFIGKGNCRSCHAGPNFTDDEFHNIGVPSHDIGVPSHDIGVTSAEIGGPTPALDALGRDQGRSRATKSIVDAGRRAGIERMANDPFNAAGAYSDDRAGSRASDIAALVRSSESFGQFKTPSLRNVALTAPYMHQGQFATLADVLHYYSTLEGAVPAGHHGEQVLRPLRLTPEEIDDVIAFLQTLTDADLPRGLTTPPSSPLPADESSDPH